MEEGIYKAVFIDSEYMGLKNGHQYQIEIIKQKYSYLIVISYDFTDNLPCDIYCPMSSTISINSAWAIGEKTV